MNASETLEKMIRERKGQLAELEEALAQLIGDEPRSFVTIPEFLAEKTNLEWLIGGQIPRGGFGFITADPRIGKTTLLAQIGVSLASGRGIFGWHVARRYKVLYLAAEGSRAAFRERVRTVTRQIGLDPYEMTWMIQSEGPINFQIGTQKFNAMVESSGADLVICDTLKYFWTGDENSAVDFNKMVSRPLKDLTEKTGASFWLVHHHRKSQEIDGWQKGRGTAAMLGDCDWWWRLEPMKDAPQGRTLYCDKNKYGAEFEPVELAFDAANAIFREVLKPKP